MTGTAFNGSVWVSAAEWGSIVAACFLTAGFSFFKKALI